MQKILIITSQFPPYCNSLGGVIRVLSFTKKLQKNKYQVHLLSKKNNLNNYFGYNNDIKKINLNYINSNYQEKPLNKKIYNRIKYNYSKLKNFLSRFGIDYESKYFFKYLFSAYSIIKKKNINLILITSPPFSLFLLTPFLRIITNKLIIIDYRDGWNTRFNSNLYISEFLEKIVIKNTYKVIVSTSVIKNDLIKKFNLDHEKIILINNGYEVLTRNEGISRIKRKDDKIHIGYFGMINDNQNSYRDINIINKLFLDKKIKENFNFFFWGDSDIHNKIILQNKNFFFKKNLSHKNALKKMCQMDYLLILHTEQETASEVMTGKFYDYLSSNKKIIVISEGETLVGKFVIENNLGYNFNILKIDLISEFKKLIKKKVTINEFVNIKKFSRDYQNNKLIDLIKQT